MVSVGSPRICLISKCWSPVLKFECLCILSTLATTISTLCSSSSDSVWMFEINLNPFPNSGRNNAFRAPCSSIIILSQPVYGKITYAFTWALRIGKLNLCENLWGIHQKSNLPCIIGSYRFKIECWWSCDIFIIYMTMLHAKGAMTTLRIWDACQRRVDIAYAVC